MSSCAYSSVRTGTPMRDSNRMIVQAVMASITAFTLFWLARFGLLLALPGLFFALYAAATFFFAVVARLGPVQGMSEREAISRFIFAFVRRGRRWRRLRGCKSHDLRLVECLADGRRSWTLLTPFGEFEDVPKDAVIEAIGERHFADELDRLRRQRGSGGTLLWTTN